MKQERTVTVSVGEGKYRLWATAVSTGGEGINVTLGGGEVPHLGAVAIAIPRPSLQDPSKVSATTSVYLLVGHKDDALAKPLADRMARALQQPVVVAAGVHLGAPGTYTVSPEEIKEVLRTNEILAEELIRRFNNES
jgi:hypothetical protein